MARGSSAQSIVTPGHVPTIVAHRQGLKARKGHTEASVAIVKLAGFLPYASGCEVVCDNGDVASRKDISEIISMLGLKIGLIKDLCDYLDIS